MSVPERIISIKDLAARIGRQINLMEVCGTHTMTAFRAGLRSQLPSGVNLLSGPGCPVCVTPADFIDRAIAIARLPQTLIATFGDLLRVPGTESSLEIERARGARVSVVYSPLDALAEAERNPELKLVFLGVGFETTAPAIAWTIKQAAQNGQANFLVLCAHKTMPPAMAALLKDQATRIDGFLCPGHVSSIIGAKAYQFIGQEYHIPCVIAGFEPADMLAAIEMLLRQIAARRAEVQIQYTRGVTKWGNQDALLVMQEVFEECDDEWRGLGVIPKSGLRIRAEFRAYDALTAFPKLALPAPARASRCICGDILRGTRTPLECPLFRKKCSPASPVGACMVSSEGTCAAYYKYAARIV